MSTSAELAERPPSERVEVAQVVTDLPADDTAVQSQVVVHQHVAEAGPTLQALRRPRTGFMSR